MARMRKVKEKWKHDGHTGVVFLYFEETCCGFDRAREMGESWQAKRQGKEEWARIRPPRKRHWESIQQEYDTWQRYSRDLVEEDGSRRLFCYLATVDDMERIEGHEKGERWHAITAEELEARRKREKDSLLEGNLEHAKTRLTNDALTQQNKELTSRVEDKESELQTIRMERAHLNDQHEIWVNERLERIARAHREETLAAQKKADAEKAALEAQLKELHQAREGDQAAMVALKQDAEIRERRLRHVFETGLKAIDQEYNEKEKAAMTRADEMLQREREKLQKEKEAATRSWLAEQEEKMRAIESARAETEALQKEAQRLRAALLERAKTEETEVIDVDNECQFCTEPFSEDRRRAMLGCGHTTMCKPCSEKWLTSDKFKPTGKRKRPSYECPLRCKLGQNSKVIELLGPIGMK